MKLVVDMNLSPAWVDALSAAGHEVVHWSTVGRADATDATILRWALGHDHVVFTHDLDFGAILAATNADSPSVVQIRTQDITPKAWAATLSAVLAKEGERLAEGALLSLDEHGPRLRVLPIRREARK